MGTQGLLAAARAENGAAIIDSSMWTQHEHVLEGADFAVVVTRHRARDWYPITAVDRRPDWVCLMAWLDGKCETDAWERRPTEELLLFLDWRFDHYLVGREMDGDPAVYDREDIDWWCSQEVRELGEDDELALPAAVDAPHLDGWRQDFLRFLDAEGFRRRGDEWAAAASVWAQRNKERNLLGLGPGDAKPGEEVARRASFLDRIAGEATKEWGQMLWQEHRQAWANARLAGDDLLGPWQHVIETVVVPEPADVVAQVLAAGLGRLPEVPVLVAVNHASRNLAQSQVTAVGDELRGLGLAGVFAMPALKQFGQFGQQLLRPGGEAAALGNRLARYVGGVLRRV
ncbi:hypothetical protein [Kitasatospora sp. NPDC088779]|uniref:hypothetical protein n=1 Tax=Kitasatospora sp. NPDC088779 TaxID=3154964 RepID=UPI003444D83B